MLSIVAVDPTDLFAGPPESPRQIVRVTVEGMGSVTVTGPGVRGAAEATGPSTVEIPLEIDDASPGEQRPIEVNGLAATLTVAEPGWTMFLVSHFHYDPVWWNTQAAYTSPWEWLAADATTRPLWERNGFALVEAHLELALRDPDYRFVLAEIDYLKPFFDTHPHRRADLRRLLGTGQVELVGGTYNEPNTNLTGAETTIRNIVYGIGYQRDILGGDPQTAWQLDVFGHDPQFPGHLAEAGLTASAWARGPFHQWGPIQKNFGRAHDDATVMQFPSEFEWLSPSGRGVLTHFMPHHYSAGWPMDSAPDLESAEAAVYDLYRKLKPVAATKNILLPTGTDYTPPNKWVTAIHRSWAAKYAWPRFVCGTPRDFLDAVRAELAAKGLRPSPQTRDMNPVYTGKDVSYIDTKQAQRAGEVAAADAEKLATLASLHGFGRYPHAALDKVWRHLAYGAHHDAITGSESDQVYIDLLGGWREAYDLAAAAVRDSLDAFAARIDTAGPGRAVVVTNTLGFGRSALVSVPGGGRVLTAEGAEVPCVAENGTVTFLANDVPGMGWRTWRLGEGQAAGWTALEGLTIENERFVVSADPARGGGLSRVDDKLTGRALLREGTVGNELRVYDEYPTHPDFGEGPWHLVPSGPVTGSSEASATSVRAETSPLGQRIVVTGEVDGVGYEQITTLWRGLDRVDFRTRIVSYQGQDKLLRVRFPAALPGALPVSDVASAVIGRGFALPDVDSAQAPWTLDNPCHTWFGLGSTARVRFGDGRCRAIGVAEVVVPSLEEAAEARDLVVALARVGVTATTAAAGWARYGWLDVDSNLPDVRILVGGPERNAASREVLERAGTEYAEVLRERGLVYVPGEKGLAEVWRPNADLRDLRALPVLIAVDPATLVSDLDDAVIEAVCPGEPHDVLTEATVALLTYGLPGFAVDPTGALHLSLMRSCTGWPSGVWIDPPKRTLPDGAAFQLQHWTHEFGYALVSGDGDWRALGLPARGQEFSHPLYATVAQPHDGPLPPSHALMTVRPEREVLLNALKPSGNPIAQGLTPSDPDGVTVRLAEATGFGRTASVESPLWDGLYRGDLLERPVRRTGPLAGSEIVTLMGQARFGADGPVLGPQAEPAQPVYARYWLHNRGPAPMGYLPVTVAVSPGVVTESSFSVSLASQLRDAAVEGLVQIVAPPGWSAGPATRPYRLEALGHLAFDVSVQPPQGTPDGLYFVAARIVHDGQTVEDVATFAVGAVDLPTPTALPDDWAAAQGTSAHTGRDTGLDVSLSPSFELTLTNRTRDEIRGEVQVVSPWGSWERIPEPVRGFTVAAGQTLRLPVRRLPGDGNHWAMAKVMWFGRCQYSECVPL